MNVSELLVARRAVKWYDPNFQIPETVVKEMLAKAMLAPSSFNIQHWRIVWVQDKAIRQRIREKAWDQAQVTDASALFVLTAKVDAWEASGRYWEGVPKEIYDWLVSAIHNYYNGRPTVARDECMRSLGLIGMALMLLAKEYGYDSCPMVGFDFDAVGEIINLPEDHVIGFMLAIGKSVKEPWSRVGKLPMDEVLVINGF